MASGLAGASNNQTCTESELLTISLALALKRSDADRFLQIYDNSIPNSFGTKKVEEIKERARELSEKSTEELENLRGDLEAGQNLVQSVFQNFRINGFASGQTDTTEAKSYLGSVDRNHNCLSHEGRVGEVEAAAMTLKTDEKEETVQIKGADLGAIKTGNNALKVHSPGMRQKQVLPDSTSMDDSTMLDGNASGAAEPRRHEEAVDDKIQSGIKPRQKMTERPNNVITPKGNVLGKRKADSETEVSKKDNGPYPPSLLLEKSIGLIRTPKNADVKNCPPPELIVSPNQVSEHPLNEISPTAGHRSPLKRQGEQQKDVELQNVYDSPTVTAYNFHSAEQQCSSVGNENFTCFQGNQASCNDIHSPITDKISRDGSVNSDSIRKKKRKKKKKTKQGDNGTESTTEGEEVRSPPNGLIPPTSAEQTAASKRKTSGESTSEKEDLSGENEAKVFSSQKTKHSKDSVKDKCKRTKGVEPDKRKKTEMRKKKGHEEAVSLEVKKMPEAKDSSKQLPISGGDEEEEQDRSELEEDVFLGRRTRPEEDITTSFRKLESEPDCRAAMSDPGENDEDHGGFNLVQNRKTRRKEKFASSNFYSRRDGDATWDLRKSSSLPKEMCNYSSSRGRIGTNETEELVSTTTTTTTTASSRRDSLESDENSFEQKKQSGFSYASRLKANILGSGHVQSQKDGDREGPNNLEGAASPLCHSNMKPKINSTNDVKNDSFDRTLLKSTHQEYKEEVHRNVPSSSLSTAMSLEVTASARKFDLNFPDLTSAASSSKGERSSESQTESVQYLDLEFTKNSYAGRLKQSLWNSNTRTASPTVDVQSIRTTERTKDTDGVTKDSSTPDAPYSVNKETDGRIVSSSSNKGETKDGNVYNLPVESQRENFDQVTISSVETNCKAEGYLVQADNERIDVSRGTDSQPQPSNAGVPNSNPIWFGSLIVSEDGIVDLDESGKAGSPNESSLKPPTFHGNLSAPSKDGEQVDVLDKKCVGKRSVEQVIQSKGGDAAPGSSATVSDGTVVVELFSANKVNIDVSGMWLKTRNFNHEEVTEMFLRDWEETLKQSRDFPESVCIAHD